MNNKIIKLSLYTLSFSIIFSIVYFWGLPIQQHKIFKKINNGINTNNIILSPYQEKILGKKSNEKESIITYHLSITTKEYEENPTENKEELAKVLLDTEKYIEKNKNWYIKPNIYMDLSYAYLLLYKTDKIDEFKNKSMFYSEKSLVLFPNRDEVYYRYLLTRIQLDIDKESNFIKVKERYNENKDLNLNIHDYYMGLTYYYMNDNKNSIVYLDKFSKHNQSKGFIVSYIELKNIYYNMLKDFYSKKDLSNTTKVLERLIFLNDQNKDFFSYIQNYIREKGRLPDLKLNY